MQEALLKESPTPERLLVVVHLKRKQQPQRVMAIITVAVATAIIIMVVAVTTKPIKRQKNFLKPLMRLKSRLIEFREKSKTSTPMHPMYFTVRRSAKMLSKTNLLLSKMNLMFKEKVRNDTRKKQIVLNYLNLGRRKYDRAKLTLKMLRMRSFGIRYKSIKSGMKRHLTAVTL